MTTIYVTHDQVEAMTLGQRAAVMRAGRIQQVDAPQRLYSHPANAFVAAFIGSPPMNFAVGEMDGGRLRFGGFELAIPEQLRPPVRDGEGFLVGVRPEDLREPDRAPGEETIEAECIVHQDLGADVLLFLAVTDGPGDLEAVRRITHSEEQDPYAASLGQARLFCARVSGEYPVRGGDTARLAIAPRTLHYFALADGRRLEPVGQLAGSCA